MRYRNAFESMAMVAVLALTSTGQGEPATKAAVSQNDLVLENASCRVEIDRQHGCITRLQDKRGSIDLRPAAELAENFRLLVSLSDDPRTCIYGKDQMLSEVTKSDSSLTLSWKAPLKDQRGQAHAIDAEMRIELDGDAIAFRFSLVNRTQYKIQEVWYPAIGGLLGFGPPESCAKTHLNPPPHQAKRFCKPFGGHMVGYPTQNMGFVQIYNPDLNRGLYLGAHDPIARFKAFNFVESNAGQHSDVAAFLVNYAFVPPGVSFEGPPLVARFHAGDWIAAGKQIYRPWFIRTFGLMTPDQDWIRQHSFFQMIMIMLPEGNVNYTIRQIPDLARDGLKYGLSSLQIAGWQFGGHDNGYPYYEPDPRLGTWDDLKEAIQQCHRMGVKVYFFANIHVANVDTEWYKAELKDHVFETIRGAPAWVAGWGMGTLASRMGLTVPLMSFNDVSFPGFADGQLKYFKKLAEVGADGIHIDKCFPQAFNFNPRVTMNPAQAPWEGTVRLLERISRECRAIHPDFRISAEINWDRFLSYGNATWWAGNMSIARQVFPELVETIGLYQPYDYITLNDAIRNGHVVMVSPHHFNRSMEYETWHGLSNYIREVKKIRDELADYVFLGEPIAPGQVQLTFDKQFAPAIEHAVYRHLSSGKRACIVSNRSSTAVRVSLAGFDDKGTVRIYAPGEAAVSSKLPASFTVNPERVVFVVEQ